MYSVIVRIVNTLEQNGADYMLHAYDYQNQPDVERSTLLSLLQHLKVKRSNCIIWNHRPQCQQYVL